MDKRSVVDREGLARRIKTIRGKRTLMEFGALVGVSHTSVKAYEAGERIPDIDTLLRIAKAGPMDLGRLLLGRPLPPDLVDQGKMNVNLRPSRAVDRRSLAEPDGEEFLSVPLTEGKIAAGEAIIADEHIIDHILLHVRVLKQTGASRNLIACRVAGESMVPHLNEGDIVVIDRDIDREAIVEKKIYAVFDGAGITAKMVQREGPRLFLIPLNQAERIRSVDLREVENPLVGLIIGAWRNFEGRII
ncbi:MAG: helix-turn-helix domain-containing protein [Nitrospinae bacterium]|nr:helix-turn-helix domain-containing protein [Nitrospinota bacterium]